MPVTREALAEYLRGIAPPGTEPDDDTPLISDGLVDSFAMLGLITWLEKTGGFKLRATEVNLSNLDTIARILRLAESKQAEGGDG